MSCELVRPNNLLLNIGKTDYIFFGPHYSRVYEKGEHDMEELQSIAPQYLFSDPYDGYTGPEHGIVNKKGEFKLQELYDVAPMFYLEEHIITNEGDIIMPSESVKYLGMHIDSKLQFQYHINIITCRFSRLVSSFWNSIELSMETKKIIYHSLVESHLNYGITIWGSEYAKNLTTNTDYNRVPNNLKNINTTQNKVIRAMLRKPKYNKKTKEYTHMLPLYKQLGILRIQELYYYNLGILAYSYFNKPIFPQLIKQKYDSFKSEHNHNTRSKYQNLDYKRPNNYNTYREPSIASSMYWNSLPNQIKNANNIKSFKNMLKEHLLKKYDEVE